MWPTGRYLRMFHLHQYIVFISLFLMRNCYIYSLRLAKSVTYAGLIAIRFYLLYASVAVMSLMALEIHSNAYVEFLYTICRVPTSP